jgi:hypothetical protein
VTMIDASRELVYEIMAHDPHAKQIPHSDWGTGASACGAVASIRAKVLVLVGRSRWVELGTTGACTTMSVSVVRGSRQRWQSEGRF